MEWIIPLALVLFVVVLAAGVLRERRQGIRADDSARRHSMQNEADVRRSVQNPGNGPGMIGGS